MIAAGLASGISGWVSAVLGGASKAAAIRRKVGGGLLAMAVTDVIEAALAPGSVDRCVTPDARTSGVTVERFVPGQLVGVWPGACSGPEGASAGGCPPSCWGGVRTSMSARSALTSTITGVPSLVACTS